MVRTYPDVPHLSTGLCGTVDVHARLIQRDIRGVELKSGTGGYYLGYGFLSRPSDVSHRRDVR